MTTDRATDARVAEKVMGWQRWEKPGEHGPEVFHPNTARALERMGYVRTNKPLADGAECGPAYTSDPAADLSVLEHVRTTWDLPALTQFVAALSGIYAERWRADSNRVSPSNPAIEHTMYHRVGDYSRAALAALDQGVLP